MLFAAYCTDLKCLFVNLIRTADVQLAGAMANAGITDRIPDEGWSPADFGLPVVPPAVHQQPQLLPRTGNLKPAHSIFKGTCFSSHLN